MFKPVQFSSQYTFDVLYQGSPTGSFKSVQKPQTREWMMRQALRPTHQSGVPLMGVSYNGEPRLMVDDTRIWDADRVPDATLTRNIARDTEANQAQIREQMMEDETLGLGKKPPAEVSDILSNPFELVQYELGRRGAITPEDRTDNLKLYFIKGEGNRPVLDHVELDTRSNKLYEMSQRAPEEREGIEDDLAPPPTAEDGSPALTLQNPIEALRAALALPFNKITVNPFSSPVPEAPVAEPVEG